MSLLDVSRSFILPVILFTSVCLDISLVCLFIFRKKLQIIQNYGTISICIADILFSICAFPAVDTYGTAFWLNNYAICAVIFQFITVQYFTNILTVFYATLERFIAVRYPFKYPVLITPKTVIISLSICWIYPIFYGILPSFGWFTELEIPENASSIYCNYFTYQPNSYILLGAFHALVIVCIVTALYLFIFKEIMQRRKTTIVPTTNVNKYGETSKMFLVFVFYNVISWIFQVVNSVRITSWSIEKRVRLIDKDELIIITMSLLLTRALFNAIIYGFSRPSFRTEFKEAMKSAFVKLCKKNSL